MAPQKPQDAGKLTVVLDIDETLIHTDTVGQFDEKFKYNGEEKKAKTGDITDDLFHLELDDFKVKVFRRPHLDWFLKEASSKFELVTFTAGVKMYGTGVLNKIDPEESLIQHRFFRHNCTPIGNSYTKDLSHLGRPLSRVVLVDNNPICFLPNPDNGIPVSSYYAEKSDDTLLTLMKFLDHLDGHKDVRPVLQQYFNLRDRLGVTVSTAHL